MAGVSEFEEKKRQLIKKKRRNRIKRRMIIFAFLFICIGIIFTVLKAPFFNVKTIVCVGQQELTEEQIIKIAGAKTDVNIFSIGVKNMKSRLAENPAIEESNVRRLYPNKIKIWVRESKAFVYAESGGKYLLADKNGQVLKLLDAGDNGAVTGLARLDKFEPQIVKPGEYIFEQDNPVHKNILECMRVLDKLELLDKVTVIEASDLSDIRIDYQDRLYIMLGDAERLEYKLTFAKKVISENLSEYEKAILDYRGEKLYVGPRVEEEQPIAEEEAKTDADAAENVQETKEVEEEVEQ